MWEALLLLSRDGIEPGLDRTFSINHRYTSEGVHHCPGCAGRWDRNFRSGTDLPSSGLLPAVLYPEVPRSRQPPSS